jgi:hypothetical protein
MRIVLATGFAIAVLNVTGLRGEPQQRGNDLRETRASQETYDGRWWLAADAGVQSGFLNGAADCLTWSARIEGFSATPEQLVDKITEYYRTHPADRALLITEVWRKLESRGLRKKSTPGGESWENPHWYLNGLWWGQSSKWENTGFVEGYLWCAHAYLKPPANTYSRPASYYVDRINTYFRSHPQAEDQAVATILARFRDRRKGD